MASFVGIVDAGRTGVFSVRVPDVPGCHGSGVTADAAIVDAIGTLREMAEQANSAQRRSAEEIIADPDVDFDSSGEGLVILPLLAERGQSARANISLDAGILSAIDDAAELSGETRSAFLVNAAIEKIIRAG